MNGNAERLARSFSELVELQLVLEKASSFFDDAQTRASSATFQTQPADAGSCFYLTTRLILQFLAALQSPGGSPALLQCPDARTACHRSDAAIACIDRLR